MFKKIKGYLLIAASTLMVAVPAVAIPAASYATCSTIQNSISTGVNSASEGKAATDADCSGSNSTDNLQNTAKAVVNWMSIIVGIVAVIMVIYGGFRYITSGGDSNNVSSAKSTLIYAIIGLIIVALAQVIVHFVLNGAANATSGTTGA